MIKYDCFFTTDVGNVRTNNEDNFFLNGAYKLAIDDLSYEKKDFLYRGGLFAVCDGMGGAAYGEKASYIAVELLKKYRDTRFDLCVHQYVAEANEKICDLIKENNGKRSGTTLALVYIDEKSKATIYNVGDSRVYLYRKGKLIQLSEDHTAISGMLRMGIITREEAATHKRRHELTQHLGIFPDELIIEAAECELEKLRNKDIFLLCSDGLTDMVSDQEIADILGKKLSAEEYGRLLKETALKNGGRDNVTVGIIKVIGRKYL